mgnify:FL=1
MGNSEQSLILQPGDMIVSLDDAEVGILVKRKKIKGLLNTNIPATWVWIVDWVKGGTRAAQVWGAIHHNEEDLLEDVKSGYWTLYRALD